jgi:putative membrane protein
MLGFLLRLAAPAIALVIARQLFPEQFAIPDWGAAAAFAVVLALLNAFVKPVVAFLSMPITCLTLGLFHVVLNAIFFAIAASLTGIGVAGVTATVIGALLVSAVSLAASWLTK